MKTPPFLLSAGVLFWGWQSHLLIPAALMALVIESPRWLKARWDFSDDDFNRIWTFCALLALAATVYAFSMNEGPANFGGFFKHPDLKTERGIGTSTARTAALVLRWLPMIFFLFLSAQLFSTREGIPLQTISLILRRRWKQAKKLGIQLAEPRPVNVSYPYFALCLVSATVHASEDTSFFWGMAVLAGWALWPHRARGVPVWTSALAACIILGFFGQGGISRLRGYMETLNPQWLLDWSRRGTDPRQSKTALGQIGRIKTSSRIVIRLEPREKEHPPTLLREASYRGYKSASWHASAGHEEFETIIGQQDTFLLVPGKTNNSVVNIACYLDSGKGLLPLPTGCGRLENLPAWAMKRNSLGAVITEGPGLVIFDALYGPGRTMDAPPDLKEDFTIPAFETNALIHLINEFQLAGQSRETTLRRINALFESQFSYSLWQESSGLVKTNESPLSRFLLKTRSGHCEFFATATVLLLRQLNMPARYAVGYAVHEASGRKYVVRQRDAHAWCLAWDPHTETWQDFDTTPGVWMAAEAEAKSPFEFLSDAWARLTFEIARLRWGQTNLRQYILYGLIPILGFLLYQIISRGRSNRQAASKQAGDRFVPPGLDSEFYAIERRLAQSGIIRDPAEPLKLWLGRVLEGQVPAGEQAAVLALLNLHYQYRFDPNGLARSEREDLRRKAGQWLETSGTRR
jgi:hypothetical protein